jgi:hypothetical protein
MKRLRMIKARLITLVAVVFYLTTVWCSAADKAANDGKILFENNCGEKTKEEWKTTVFRMKQNGADITDDEANIIINYLSETYK